MFRRAAAEGARQWEHVDLRRRVIHVESSYTIEGGFGMPKNGKSRDVPTSPTGC